MIYTLVLQIYNKVKATREEVQIEREREQESGAIFMCDLLWEIVSLLSIQSNEVVFSFKISFCFCTFVSKTWCEEKDRPLRPPCASFMH